MKKQPPPNRRVAIVGAGIAGMACARTLAQAGHAVTVFEKSRGYGGRMATRRSPFGSFDHGAQYFTVRDARLERALATTAGLCRAWSANAVRVLDPAGRLLEAAPPSRESHWVPIPGMSTLVHQWAAPLEQSGAVQLQTQVTRIQADPLARGRWQLHTQAADGAVHVHAGFDQVLLAIPAPQAAALLGASSLAPGWVTQLAGVTMAPCWTLMLAYPNAAQGGRTGFGPQWNAARSTHHRVAWLARESSKPRREPIERWTVQASADWSQQHLEDTPERVQGKLLKAFAEVTGIRAEPGHAEVHRWRYAKTQQALGPSHLWDRRAGIGLCGDWCLGHRVENAFVSGLELALATL